MNVLKVISKSRIFTYPEFIDYVNSLWKSGSVTGLTQSTDRLNATKINLQRMRRLSRAAQISKKLISEVENIEGKWKWTLIVEGWCGDAAQLGPYIYKVSELSESIDLEIILRDENPEIMDDYLVDGNRSIPILICTDDNSKKELGFWGSRPKSVVNWIESYKIQNPNCSPEEFKKDLHLFYTKDKGDAINKDLYDAIIKWKKNADTIISK